MWPTWLASLFVSALLQAVSGQLRPEDQSTNSTFVRPVSPRRETCENARLKCAYRTGCGQALQNYVMSCSFILDSEPRILKYCPEPCQHALIALTSTEEGKNLMNVSSDIFNIFFFFS